MMTELMLVEGVSDVQLISYFLQNVYGWKHEKNNPLGIDPMDENEHIEYLSKDGDYLVLCGVGGNGKFAHFVEQHRINEMLVEQDISSIMVVTDRDEASNSKIERSIQRSLKDATLGAGQWKENVITDSFGQPKKVDTYLLIVPATEEGALERVIIHALEDIPEETELIQEVIQFVESLKEGLVPELNKINRANKFGTAINNVTASERFIILLKFIAEPITIHKQYTNWKERVLNLDSPTKNCQPFKP